MELLEDMIMVDYEDTTSKKDFDDLLEGTNMKLSNKCIDLSLESHCPSSSWLNFSFRGLGKTLSFDLPRGC
jgi:hypothetical protein